ncbi:hypothetical protein MKX03_018320 [Papaver bracteatum]|nr:hypothetical protein MKX03_018320 [Papaver bracteatum]
MYPTLDFRYWRTGKGTKKQKLLETKCFMNFMDTVLFLHEKPNIQKFYLDLDEVSDEPRVNRWISILMKRKVEAFCLYLNCSSTSSIFPLSFFTCDSLTLLDLCFDMRSSGKLIIPNTVYFPKLKILRLSYLSFADETSTRKLFSNCSMLEELRLSDCSLPEGLCIVNPTLKHLFINSCSFSKSKLRQMFACTSMRDPNTQAKYLSSFWKSFQVQSSLKYVVAHSWF